MLTRIGHMATHIAEVHPLIMAKMIEETSGFRELSTKQLVGLLSTMADIKVPEEMRCSIPKTEDVVLRPVIKRMVSMYTEYETKETERRMYTGIRYQDALKFDIIDYVMEWCECVDEAECKEFIQTRLNEKEISVGDYAKAMMKISAIAKEFMGVAQGGPNGSGFMDMEFLKKLSEVDAMILKYIATTQSLYV